MNDVKALLHQRLHYDEQTGVFTWLRSFRGPVKPGDIAGVNIGNGYFGITIEKKRYLSHRLAWLYVHGEWPKGQIDHIDGNPANNAIANLRDVSRSQNMQNIRRAKKNSRTGLLGVCESRGKFQAAIRVNGKTKTIGRFDTAELAHKAYLKTKRELHECCTL